LGEGGLVVFPQDLLFYLVPLRLSLLELWVKSEDVASFVKLELVVDTYVVSNFVTLLNEVEFWDHA